MNKRGGCEASFTLWAIIANSTSPYRNNMKDLTGNFLVTVVQMHYFVIRQGSSRISMDVIGCWIDDASSTLKLIFKLNTFYYLRLYGC